MPRYLIIGIDPGHTVGVAALDLSGHFMHVAHVGGDRTDLRATGLSAAVSIIEKWGTPSLIATDVRPAPEMALKLASAFNVPLFVPQRPWREEDKKEALHEMVERMKHSPPPHARGADSGSHHASLPSGSRSSSIAENAHERDALSAAIQAWRANQNLLREADAREMPDARKERFKHLLLQGYRTDFALQKVDEENRPAQAEIVLPLDIRPAPRSFHPPASSLAASIPTSLSVHLSSLERQNIELKKRIQLLEHEREGALHRIRLLENGVRERIMREHTLRQMNAEISRLRHTLERMYQQMLHQNKTKIKPASFLSPKTQLAPKPDSRPVSISNPEPDESQEAATTLKVLDPYRRLQKMLQDYRQSRTSKPESDA